MVEAFDLFNAMKVTENISGIIHFEKHRPQSTENMNGLLYAIQNRVNVVKLSEMLEAEQFENEQFEKMCKRFIEYKAEWKIEKSVFLPDPEKEIEENTNS